MEIAFKTIEIANLLIPKSHRVSVVEQQPLTLNPYIMPMPPMSPISPPGAGAAG
jgi:hypothetical protein